MIQAPEHLHCGDHDYGEAGGDRASGGRILTIRSHSGLSGDMLLTGLALMCLETLELDPYSTPAREWLTGILEKIMPELVGTVLLERHMAGGISGWRARVELPHVHEHRNLAEISAIVEASTLSAPAREMALKCFALLAECEAAVHGKSVAEIHFHEVGALDSILDICAVCELRVILNPSRIICGPLPLADGQVKCAHGILPAPAPAVLRLLRGVPVRPFGGDCAAGELVTPTAIALLHALGVEFGPWPSFELRYTALVYGQRYFPDAPNGVIFALGEARAESGSGVSPAIGAGS